MLTTVDVTRCLNLLEELHTKVSVFTEIYENRPVKLSQAKREIDAHQNPEFVYSALSQIGVLLEVVGDHLICFLRVCREPAGSITPWTAVRAVFEACALGVWLSDPKIDVQTRLGRSFSLRFSGVKQQSKVIVAFRGQETLQLDAPMNNLLEEAQLLELPIVKNGKGKIIGIHQVFPSYTELVASQLGYERFYRLFSAIVHGHLWALQNLSFRVGDFGEPQADASPRRFLEKHIEIDFVVALAALSLKSMWKFMRVHSIYYGWDTQMLRDIFVDIFTKLPKGEAKWT